MPAVNLPTAVPCGWLSKLILCLILLNFSWFRFIFFCSAHYLKNMLSPFILEQTESSSRQDDIVVVSLVLLATSIRMRPFLALFRRFFYRRYSIEHWARFEPRTASDKGARYKSSAVATPFTFEWSHMTRYCTGCVVLQVDGRVDPSPNV